MTSTEQKTELAQSCGHQNHGNADHDCKPFLPCADPACPCGPKAEKDLTPDGYNRYGVAMCKCRRYGPVHAWEPGESCASTRVVPVVLAPCGQPYAEPPDEEIQPGDFHYFNGLTSCSCGRWIKPGDHDTPPRVPQQ